MKKLKRFFSLLLAMALVLTCAPQLPLVAQAATSGSCGADGSNVTWVLDDAGTLTISGTGAMENYNYNSLYFAPWDSQRDNVKKAVIENGVTTIGNYAFCQCDVASVEIPNCVTTIGGEAFFNCDSLASVDIPDSVTNIGGGAFESCDSLTSVEIPASATSIGSNAFYNCGSLTEICFEGSAPTFGSNVFYNVTATAYYYPDATWTSSVMQNYGGTITWVALEKEEVVASGNCGAEGDNVKWELYDDGLLRIFGTGAMRNYGSTSYGCWDDVPWDEDAVKRVVVENGVTRIGGYAFGSCENMTDVVIGESVTSIEYDAFSHCSELTKIDLPDSVSYVDSTAFGSCGSLTEIAVGASNPNLCSEDGVLFNKDKTVLICYPGGKSGAYTIPDSVLVVKSEAFAFADGLTSIVISESVVTIEERALGFCEQLKEMWFDGIAPGIGPRAFNGVTATAYYYPDTTWNSATLVNRGGTITWVERESTVLNGGSCGDAGENVKWELHNNGLLRIYGSGAMKNFSTSNAVPWHGQKDSVKWVVVESGVTAVGQYAFYHHTNLVAVQFASSVASVGTAAFSGCSKLDDVKIPESVVAVENFAFSGCTGLRDFYFEGSAATIATAAFVGVTATVYYHPDSSWTENVRQSYGGELTWLDGGTIVESGVCGVAGNNVKWTLYKDGLLRIYGTGAMLDYGIQTEDAPWIGKANSVLKVVVEDGVTSVGEAAFESCEKLISADIGDSVALIESYAFRWCTSLSELTLGDSVETIGDSAFDSCQSLSSVVFGSSLTFLDANAFINCTELKEIRFEGSAPKFSFEPFCNVTATAYYYPDETWTEDVMQDYGGTITWVAREKEEAEVELESSTEQIGVGETFTVDAVLTNNSDIRVGTVALDYDEDVFELVGGTCQVTGANPGTVLVEEKAGTFYLSTAAAVSGKLFTFQFKVKEGAPVGEYTISAQAAIGLSTGEEIPVTAATVKVGCEHSYGQWVKVSDTEHTRTCILCGGEETEGHSFSSARTAPTCKDEGYTTHTCDGCGYSYRDSKIPASGNYHKFENGVCTVCGLEVEPFNGVWYMPCAFETLAAPFGWRLHPVYGEYQFHNGVDLTGTVGTPVYATRSGKVVLAANDTTKGNYVRLDHGDGFGSEYLHLQAFTVKTGDTVQAGQLIGYLGNTGAVTSAHLQFNITYNGNYVDPEDYLDFSKTNRVQLGASAVEVKQGDTFTVEAVLTNRDAIRMGTVALSFDSSVLELLDGTCHVTGANPGVVAVAQKAGTFLLAESTVVSGKLFTFRFRVKEDAKPGSCAIGVKAATGVDTGAYIDALGTEITVVCDHSYTAVVTPPTCTGRGFTTYTCACGDSYISDYTDPAPHDYQYSTTVEPTCTADGYMRYICSGCGAVKEIVIPGTGHDYGSGTTCIHCGHSVAPGHTHSYTAVVTPPTCTDMGYTTHTCACGHSYRDGYIDQSGHDWDAGTVTKAATCTADGILTYTCADCGETRTEVIPAAHDWNETVTKEATCTQDGSVTRVCRVCGEEETGIIPAGHKWNEGSVTKQPTCTEPGAKTVTCTVCGTGESQEIPKLGHRFVNGKCTVCGAGIADVVNPDNEHPLYGMYFEIDDIVSAYGSETVNEYGVYLDHNPDAKIERVAVYLTQEGNMWRRTIACVGSNITYATYVPYLSYESDIKYTGLNSSSINIFRLSENADGIWCYSDYTTIGVNLEDSSGNLLLSLYDIGQAGEKTRIFTDLEEMKDWLENGDVLYGDVNGDKKIDGRDVNAICRYLANYDFNTGTSTERVAEGVDANGDGKIDGRDVNAICRYLANYDFNTGTSTEILGPKK